MLLYLFLLVFAKLLIHLSFFFITLQKDSQTSTSPTSGASSPVTSGTLSASNSAGAISVTKRTPYYQRATETEKPKSIDTSIYGRL